MMELFNYYYKSSIGKTTLENKLTYGTNMSLISSVYM